MHASRLAALPPPADDEQSANLLVAAKQQQFNEREAQNLATSLTDVQEFREAARRLISDYTTRVSQRPTIEGSANSPLMAQLHGALQGLVEKIASALRELTSLTDAAETRIRQTTEEIRVLHASQAAQFASLQEKHHVAGAAVRERTAAQQAVATLESLERQRSEARERSKALYEQRKEIKATYLLERERISTVREVVAEHLQSETQGKVHVRIARNADSLEYQQTLRSGLKGAGVKNHDDILRFYAASA